MKSLGEIFKCLIPLEKLVATSLILMVCDRTSKVVDTYHCTVSNVKIWWWKQMQVLQAQLYFEEEHETCYSTLKCLITMN